MWAGKPQIWFISNFPHTLFPFSLLPVSQETWLIIQFCFGDSSSFWKETHLLGFCISSVLQRSRTNRRTCFTEGDLLDLLSSVTALHTGEAERRNCTAYKTGRLCGPSLAPKAWRTWGGWLAVQAVRVGKPGAWVLTPEEDVDSNRAGLLAEQRQTGSPALPVTSSRWDLAFRRCFTR